MTAIFNEKIAVKFVFQLQITQCKIKQKKIENNAAYELITIIYPRRCLSEKPAGHNDRILQRNAAALTSNHPRR